MDDTDSPGGSPKPSKEIQNYEGLLPKPLCSLASVFFPNVQKKETYVKIQAHNKFPEDIDVKLDGKVTETIRKDKLEGVKLRLWEGLEMWVYGDWKTMWPHCPPPGAADYFEGRSDVMPDATKKRGANQEPTQTSPTKKSKLDLLSPIDSDELDDALKETELSIVNWETLPSESKLTHLTSLTLSPSRKKKMEIQHFNFAALSSLQTLVLRSVTAHVPKSVFGLQNLLKLDISNMNLVQIPSKLSQLRQLQHLDLSENKLSKITADPLTKLLNLQILRIADNVEPITVIPASLAMLTNLTSLDLKGNSHLKWPPQSWIRRNNSAKHIAKQIKQFASFGDNPPKILTVHNQTYYVHRDILATGSVDTAVYKAQRGLGNNAQMFAIKKLSKNYQYVAQREQDIMQRLSALENVVTFVDLYVDDRSRSFIIMELCDFNLHKYITEEIAAFKEEEKYEIKVGIAVKLVTTMQEIHKLGVLHGDMKPHNVLVKKVGSKLIVKIADMGHSRTTEDSASSGAHSRGLGTRGWRAWEVYHDNILNERASDIWSTAAVISWMFSGTPPKETEDEEPPKWAVEEEIQRDFPEIHPILKQMLDSNPQRRPAWPIVCSHPAFWSLHKRGKVLHELGKLIQDAKTTPNVQQLVADLDRGANTNWFVVLPPVLQQSIHSFYRAGYPVGKQVKLSELLVTFRNFTSHSPEANQNVATELGKYKCSTIEASRLYYFLKLFPELLRQVWLVLPDHQQKFSQLMEEIGRRDGEITTPN